eukprot:scaffold13890_cov76-Skeletonema_dohrnii-CCMP3373.AAC.3
MYLVCPLLGSVNGVLVDRSQAPLHLARGHGVISQSWVTFPHGTLCVTWNRVEFVGRANVNKKLSEQEKATTMF